jgi:hypothetical protein
VLRDYVVWRKMGCPFDKDTKTRGIGALIRNHREPGRSLASLCDAAAGFAGIRCATNPAITVPDTEKG